RTRSRRGRRGPRHRRSARGTDGARDRAALVPRRDRRAALRAGRNTRSPGAGGQARARRRAVTRRDACVGRRRAPGRDVEAAAGSAERLLPGAEVRVRPRRRVERARSRPRAERLPARTPRAVGPRRAVRVDARRPAPTIAPSISSSSTGPIRRDSAWPGPRGLALCPAAVCDYADRAVSRQGPRPASRLETWFTEASMKFTWFNLMPWPYLPDDFRAQHRSVWVDIPNTLYDPRKGHHVYHEYLDQLEYAETLGFDGIGCNEHHQNGYGLMPSPNLIAATLARRTSRAALCVIGNSIASYNPPIRVAEEFAMLDVISGGRLVAGFPVGTPMDTNFCYGQISALTRDKYREAHDLIMKAWASDEPFAFDGKYNQLRW